MQPSKPEQAKVHRPSQPECKLEEQGNDTSTHVCVRCLGHRDWSGERDGCSCVTDVVKGPSLVRVDLAHVTNRGGPVFRSGVVRTQLRRTMLDRFGIGVTDRSCPQPQSVTLDVISFEICWGRCDNDVVTKAKVRSTTVKSWLRVHLVPTIIAVAIAVVFATGAPWWVPRVRGQSSQQGLNVVGFAGGCETFRVYAQNRWNPYGTVKMNAPDRLSTQIGGCSPNQTIAVDGWVHGRVAYPNNTPPWNSDAWFHVTDGGWVSFGGVRDLATEQDPSGVGDGGVPAPLASGCEGSTT